MNVSKACEKFPLDRRTYYEWLKNDPQFEQDLEDMKEADIDEAEEIHRVLRRGIPKINSKGKITGYILAPSRQAVEFYLLSKARSRGYGDNGSAINPHKMAPPKVNFIKKRKKK